MADQLSAINSLMNLYSNVKKMDPRSQMAENPRAREILEQVSAARLLRERLQEVQKIKGEGGFGVNTGPLIGRWRPEGGYDRQGNPEGPGFISQIMSAIKPDSARQRTRLSSLLNEANQYAFELGGKQLTGTEKPVTNAMIPTMYFEDEAFDDRVNDTINRSIPMQLEEKAQSLLDLGMDETAVRNLLQKSLR